MLFWFGGSVMQPNNNGGFLGRVFVSAAEGAVAESAGHFGFVGRREACRAPFPPALWPSSLQSVCLPVSQSVR